MKRRARKGHTLVEHQDIIKQHLKILKELQYPSGLFAASSKSVDTGYDKSWLRDNFYECLAFEVTNDWDTVEKTYNALLKIFLKHETKIDHAIAKKPDARFQYIHARFHPETFDEFWEEWGNKQNDSIGSVLFRIGELEKHKKGSILKNPNRVRIINKLVRYLASVEYWKDEDNGMWEENEEIHASSVGACVAGLAAIKKLPKIKVDPNLIKKGKQTLRKLLPRESKKKFVDLALLSLIWPYKVTTKKETETILDNVEYHLLRKKGVIRYKNDYYYNKNTDGYSEEAEWTFGLSWLAIIYEKMGDVQQANFYIEKMLRATVPKGVPELYYSNTDKPNENTPLGWSESLFIVALYYFNEKHMESKESLLQAMKRHIWG